LVCYPSYSFSNYFIIVIVYWMVSDGDQFAGAFTVPPPSAFLGVPHPDITCTFKQTGIIYGANGLPIGAEQHSPALVDAPLLDLLTQSGIDPAGFAVDARIKCDFPDNSRLNLVIAPSQLATTVLSKDNNNNKIVTEGIGWVTNQRTLQWSNNEVVLGAIAFSIRDIEEDLPVGNYNSLQELQLTGIIEMYYEGFQGQRFFYYINFNDVPIWFNLKMVTSPSETDTDNDGIFDDVDQCPSQPETYNGYQDTDGCPDVNPDDVEPEPVEELCFVTYTNSSISSPQEFACTQQWRDAFCNGTYVCFVIGDATPDCVRLHGVGYTWNGSVCIPPNTGEPDTEIAGDIAFEIKMNIENNSPQVLLARDDDNPFSFLVPATILRSDSQQQNNKLLTFIITPFVRYDDVKIFNNIRIDEATGKIKTTVLINNQEFLVGESNLENFRPQSGSTSIPRENGISLGFVELSANRIENVIPTNVVPLNTKGTFAIKFEADGMFTFSHNRLNEGWKTYEDISFTGASSGIKNLIIIRGTPTDDCEEGQIKRALSGGGHKCLDDTDRDGIPDIDDACPRVKGSADNDGCPDKPECDGVEGADESCTPLDSDNDGTPDFRDACPFEAGLPSNNGCPPEKEPLDSDDDGIPDIIDLCPFEKGLPENQGCPPQIPRGECPSGTTQRLSITDPLVCIVIPPEIIITTGDNGICFVGTCVNESNLFLMLGIGGIIAGLAILAIKRRR